MSDNTGNGFCSSSGPAVATVEVPEDDEAGIGVTTVERPEACMFSPEFTPLNALRLTKDCLAYFNKHATRNKRDNGSIFVNAREDTPTEMDDVQRHNGTRSAGARPIGNALY